MEILSSTELDDFERGRLVLDCPHAVMRPAAGGPAREGSAVIDQDQHGALQMKVLFRQGNAVASFGEMMGCTAGQYIPESLYKVVDATDWHGRVWTTAPFFGEPFVHQGEVLRGHPRWVSATQGVPQETSASYASMLIVAPNVEVPPNDYSATAGIKSLARTSSCGLQFLMTNREGAVDIEVKGEPTAFNASTPYRIAEAIEFLLGRPVHGAVIGQRGDGRSTVTLRELGRAWDGFGIPPLPWDDPHNSPYAWDIFDCYLRHISGWREEHTRHPLAAVHNGIIHAMDELFESQRVRVAVAIEQVVKQCFEQELLVPRDLPSDWERAIGIVEASDMSPESKKQIVGMMRGRKSKRPVDVMAALEERGALPRGLVDQWKKMRNTSAHGDRILAGDQKYLDQLSANLALYFRLIFKAIGYGGRFRDYARQGYPVAEQR